MASRWSDIFEREPEHEPELGPSNEPGPQPDSCFADKVEDVPPMQATQAPQPEAEFQDGIEVEEEVILCAGLLPGAQIAERVGRALALLARTKVRAPARPRARHPAPSAPLLCALQVPGPVQALAQRQRRARRRQAAGRRLKPAPVLRGATSTSSTRSPTGRAGRGRGLEVRPRAPHRPLCVRYDPCHPLHRSRTARRPHLPPDPLSPHGRLTPLPHPFAQVLARGPLTSRRLGGGAARRRSGGGLTRPGRPDDPAARRRHRGGAGARRAVAEAVVPPPLERGCGPNIQFMRRACRVLVFLFAS